MSLRRKMREDMDRMAGEILERWQETDVCLDLFARREALRYIVTHEVTPAEYAEWVAECVIA